MIPRKIKIALFLGLIIFAGFIRDFIFYNLSARIQFLEGYPHNFRHSYFKILDGLSHSGMIGLKWVFTGVFTLIFFLLNWGIIYLITRNKLSKLLGILYAAITGVSALLYLLFLLTNKDFLYLSSMEGMHLLQSALPAIILIPVLLILPHLQKSSTS